MLAVQRTAKKAAAHQSRACEIPPIEDSGVPEAQRGK
jgi:hypothetical protein